MESAYRGLFCLDLRACEKPMLAHNEQLADMADRKIVMRDGHILEGG